MSSANRSGVGNGIGNGSQTGNNDAIVSGIVGGIVIKCADFGAVSTKTWSHSESRLRIELGHLCQIRQRLFARLFRQLVDVVFILYHRRPNQNIQM